MAVSRQFASSQVARMAGLRSYPAEREARAEIGNLIQEFCADEDAAKAAVTLYLQDHEFWPTVAEFVRFLGVKPKSPEELEAEEVSARYAALAADVKKHPESYTATPEEIAEGERLFREARLRFEQRAAATRGQHA